MDSFDEEFDAFYKRMISDFLNNGNMMNLSESDIIEMFGEPTTTETINNSGVNYTIKTWETNGGVYRISTPSNDYKTNNTLKQETISKLKNKLKLALKKEEYEEAARLRDLIRDKEENKLINEEKLTKLTSDIEVALKNKDFILVEKLSKEINKINQENL
jgi:siroheme synthase (precorrin-2 oxidase/ferrochelatase)